MGSWPRCAQKNNVRRTHRKIIEDVRRMHSHALHHILRTHQLQARTVVVTWRCVGDVQMSSYSPKSGIGFVQVTDDTVSLVPNTSSISSVNPATRREATCFCPGSPDRAFSGRSQVMILTMPPSRMRLAAEHMQPSSKDGKTLLFLKCSCLLTSSSIN